MPSAGGSDVPNDVGVVAAGVVPLGVDVEAEAADGTSDGGAELGAALADAAGEDEGVDGAAQRNVVGADEGADTVDEEVEGEPRGCVLRRGDGGEVGRARQGLPAGLRVEDLLGPGDVEVLGRRGGELADVRGIVEDEAGKGAPLF